MRTKGKLISWNDDKGFGFIESVSGKFFAHISQFPAHGRRPVVGDNISFVPGKDQQGRLQAQNIQLAGQALPASKSGKALLIALSFIAVLVMFALAEYVPWFVVLWYAGLSLLAYVDYAMDKNAAQRGRRRTPENRLHLLALLGGWPGALYARQALRHKSAKTSFSIVLYITIVLNVAWLVYWLVGDKAQLTEWLRMMLPSAR